MAIPNNRMTLVCAGVVMCSGLTAVEAQAQGVSFIARRDFDAGSVPTSVAVGDFNAGGVPEQC